MTILDNSIILSNKCLQIIYLRYVFIFIRNIYFTIIKNLIKCNKIKLIYMYIYNMPAILKLSCLKIVGRRHLVAPSNKQINASPPFEHVL